MARLKLDFIKLFTVRVNVIDRYFDRAAAFLIDRPVAGDEKFVPEAQVDGVRLNLKLVERWSETEFSRLNGRQDFWASEDGHSVKGYEDRKEEIGIRK